MEMLSLQEFNDRVDTILVDKDLTGQRWEQPLPGPVNRWRAEPAKPSVNGLLVEWSTGGLSGGNCWNDDEPTPYTSSETDQELTSLEAVVGDLCPDMTYLAFRRLERLIETGAYSVNEYYGNRTDYRFRFIALDKLHAFLVEEKLLASPDASCAPR